jgi:hypothetical protein
MPAQAGMTAMDTQNTRDARGAGSGGNAIGLHGATLAHFETLLKVILAPHWAYQSTTYYIS